MGNNESWRVQKMPKIYRLGHAEVQGILNGPRIHISEKIDGCQMRITRSKDGVYWAGGRNHGSVVTETSEHDNGMHTWVRNHFEELQTWFDMNPATILIGEWTRKHTLFYSEELHNNKQFILFDAMHITDEDTDKKFDWLLFDSAMYWAENNGILKAETLYNGAPLTVKEIETCANETTSQFNENLTVEGVVIKNPDFINKFGRQNHAKVLSEKFTETKGKTLTQKNKQKKHDYTEFVERTVTAARVQKALHSLEIDAAMEHMPVVHKHVFDDVLLEEVSLLFDLYDYVDKKKLQKDVAAATARAMQKLMTENA